MSIAITDYSDLPVTINVNQLAEILGVSRKVAYRIAKEEDLAIRVGEKRLVVPKAKLINYLEKQSV